MFLAGEEQKELVQTWLISNALGGSRARSMAVQMQKAGRGLVPWAGVAVPVQLPLAKSLDPLQSQSSQEEELVQNAGVASVTKAAQALMGQAFCFLPLPCSTGVLCCNQCSTGPVIASSSTCVYKHASDAF